MNWIVSVIEENVLFCLGFSALGLVALYMAFRLVFLAWFVTKRDFKE